MSKTGGLTHILTELSSLDDLGHLLKRSARLKYTCISASRKYLALGSNTGGVYIFSRDTLKYQQVVFAADASQTPVTRVSLSPSDQHIAITISTGCVNVFELNIDRRCKPERVRNTFDHSGHAVTALTWNKDGSKLFVGDETGKLSIIFVPNKKNQTLFALPSEVIAFLKVGIFQMDWWENKLLVSTLTECFLFDTIKHNYSTIGSKKRDGEFGACIFLEPASMYPVIYCARPGSRIWEVDFEGSVLNTHQFKQLLAVPPVPVFNILNDSYNPVSVEGKGQSVSFNKMIPLGSLILTWSSKGIYLLDPINVKVMVWTNSYLGIQDIALYGNDAYVFLDSGDVHRLTLLSVYPLFQLLAGRTCWLAMGSLLLSSDQINIHIPIIKRVKKDLFDTLINGLKEIGRKDTIVKLQVMMDDVSASSVNSLYQADDFMGSPEDMLGYTTLPSGMVIVSEGFTLDSPTHMRQETSSPSSLIGTVFDGSRNDEEDAICERGDDIMKEGNSNGTESLPAVSDTGVKSSNDEIGCDNKTRIEVGMSNEYRGQSRKNEKGASSVMTNGMLVEIDTLQLDGVACNTGNEKRIENDSSQCRDKQDGNNNNNNKKELDSIQCSGESIDNNSQHVQNSSGTVSNANEPSTKVLNSHEISEVSAPVIVNSVHESIFSDSGITDLSEHREISSCFHETLVNSSEISHSQTSDSSKIEEVDGDRTADSGNQKGIFSDVAVELDPKDVVEESVVDVPVVRLNDESGDSSRDIIDGQGVPSMPSGTLTSDKTSSQRFAGVEVKNGETGAIAEAVKITKKMKRRKKGNVAPFGVEKTVTTSLKTKILRSASMGDLAESSLYQHKEKDSDTISIATISSIEEDESGEGSAITSQNSSNEMQFQFSIGSKELKSYHSHTEDSTHLHRTSFHTSYEESSKGEVIPPLRDRLAAAGKGSSDGQSVSPLTDSGEFSALMSNLPSSLSAMKDGLSLKLKGQAKHLIKSLKEKKNPRLSKSTNSSFLNSSHSDRSSSVTSNQADVESRKNENVRDSKGVSAVDEERMLMEKQAVAEVKDQLASLYRRAIRIQATVKNSNLAMKPVELKALLNDWSKELNAVMFRYLREIGQRQQKQEEKESSDSSLSLSSSLFELANKETKTLDESVNENVGYDEEVREKEIRDISGHDGVGGVSEDKRGDEFETRNLSENPLIVLSANILDKHSHPSLCHAQTTKCNSSHQVTEHTAIPLSFIGHILHINDPFHLSPRQQQVFHDLCTLCFLCGATGDILNTFQISETCNKMDLIKSYLPEHLRNVFISNVNVKHAGRDLLSSLTQKVLSADLELVECPCYILFDNIGEKSSGPMNHLSSCSLFLEGHIQNTDHNCIDDGDTNITKTAQDSSDIDLDEIHQIGVEKENNVVETLSDDQIKDLESAVFIRLFFFLLDFVMVKQEVGKSYCTKFLTWTSLVACCHERGKSDIVSHLLSERQTNGAIDYLRSGILPHPSALLGHLYRLFQYSPSKAAEFCGECPASLPVYEVVALCLLSGKSFKDPLLHYVRKHLIDAPPHERSSEFCSLCNFPVVRFLLLNALLPLVGNVANKGISGNESLSLAAKVYSILPSDWLQQILLKITSPGEQSQILRLCLTMRQWKPCIHLMSSMKDKTALIDLLVAIGDLDLIHKDVYLPQSAEEWRVLLSCFLKSQYPKPQNGRNKVRLSDQKGDVEKIENDGASRTYPTANAMTNDAVTDNVVSSENSEISSIQNGQEGIDELKEMDGIKENSRKEELEETKCKANGTSTDREHDIGFNSFGQSPTSPITWESLGKLLHQHLGGSTTIEMLCDSVNDFGDMNVIPLSPRLLQACLTDYRLQSEQSRLCHEMLERMSMYMWAKKPCYLPPSVCHMVKAEANGGGVGLTVGDGDLGYDRLVSLLQSTSSDGLMSENLGIHWSQEVDVKRTCQVCQLPLRLIVSHDHPGVTIFPCGDVFHKRCCTSPSCPIFH